MNKVLSTVKMDLLTLKAEVEKKYFLIYTSFLLILMYLFSYFKVLYSPIFFFMIWNAPFFGYSIFDSVEKSKSESMYILLGIKRKTVVTARYISALIIDVFSAIISVLISFLLELLFQNGLDIKEYIKILFIIFIIVSYIQMIQYPIFFKFGSSKSVIIRMLPLLIYFAFRKEYYNNLAEFFSVKNVIILSLIWLVGAFISLRISKQVYNQREF